MSARAAEIPTISRHHLFETLPDEIFENPKWSAHVKEEPMVRGRGYWFWKAALFNYLVRHGEFKIGDIVIWTDPDTWDDAVGGIEDEGWQKRLSCANANSNGGFDLFAESLCRKHLFCFCEKAWTKGDIFQIFNTTPTDSYYGDTAQIQSNFWIASVNERTLKFMEVWEDLLSNFHLCSDEQSVFPNYLHFKENRHDQSLFSMLTKAQRPRIRDDGLSAQRCGFKGRKHLKNPVYGIANFSVAVYMRGEFLRPEFSMVSDFQCNPWPTAIRTVAESKPQRYIYFRGERLDVNEIETATDIGELMPSIARRTNHSLTLDTYKDEAPNSTRRANYSVTMNTSNDEAPRVHRHVDPGLPRANPSLHAL